MTDFKKIAEFHAKQRGGVLRETKNGIYYIDKDDDYPSEFHKDYKEYVQDMWARRTKPFKFNKKR